MTDTNPWATSANEDPSIATDSNESDTAASTASAWDNPSPAMSDAATGGDSGLSAADTTSSLSA